MHGRLVSLLIAAGGSLAIPAVAGAGVHVSVTAYPVGDGMSSPFEVAAGDFNGDGIVDLVSSDIWTGGGDVSLLLGRGAGAFEDARVYGDDPFASVATGDFDEDGLSDIALASPASGVVVELNDGEGGFEEIPLATASSASVAIGDFDGNRHLDLVAATTNGLAVMRGDGDGGFAAAELYGPGVNGYGHVAVGDIDGDGRDDVVTDDAAFSAGSVGVLLAKSDGTLDAPRAAPFSACCASIAVGRFNADNRADVAATFAFSASVSVLLAGADGSLGAPASTPLRSTSQVVTGHANRDGRQDLVVAFSTGSLALMLGTGDGTFQAPLALPVGGRGFAHPSAIDVNADGYDDFVVGDYATGSVIVAINAPAVVASAGKLTFGSLALHQPSAPTAVTVRNDGLPPLARAGVAITGPHAADFRIVSNDCAGRTLASDETCTVSVRAEPTATGARTAELTIAGDAAQALRIPLGVSGIAPATVPAPRDMSAPRLSLAVRKQRLAGVLRRGLKVKAGCVEACRLDARLLAGSALTRRLNLPAAKALGAATARLAAPGTREVTVKLTARARRALRRVPSATLTLSVRATDAAGNARIRQRAVRLSR